MTHNEVATNRLLHLLNPEARAALSPLVPVQLREGDVIHQPGTAALQVYFPVTAVISLVSTMTSGASAEVGLVGREGLVGLSGVLGTTESPTTAVVQVAGLALHTSTARVKAARMASASVRTILDRYIEARLIQVAQSAACHRLHLIEPRLARWLLAVHDRIDGDRFTVAHERIASVLGVHRPTISIALQRLQERGAIRCRRRMVIIADRRRLETLACECYGVLRREFDRLLCLEGQNTPGRQLPDTSDGTATTALEAMREIAGRLLLVSLREQEARERAEAANQAKDQFLAMISHQLRTPLNAILGWCAMLTEQQSPTHQRGLQMIARDARTQLTVVEDLLDALRMTSATLTIQAVPGVSLAALVRGAVAVMQPIADDKHVALSLTVTDPIPPLSADPERLRQIVLNVLTNAVKFTDAGGTVEAGVRRVANGAQITVRDTGRGIAPAVLPHLFDRFRQGPAADAGQGLGLGLALARVLVELHGGTIHLDSAGDGQGTTCTIRLPLPWFDNTAGPVPTGYSRSPSLIT